MDVVAIRLSLIFLLVIFHAICIYTNGGWVSPFKSEVNIPLYNWIGMLMHSFRLETMVFISGLLLGYNSLKKQDALSFHSCVTKKAKRILLPALFFGVFYYIIFFDLQAPWYSIIWKLINGCGHLWFLPMIFWCFVLVCIISNTPPRQAYENEKYKIILVIAFCSSIINPIMFFPFGLGKASTFFIYFFMGYCIKTNRISLPSPTRKNICLAIVVFFASFLLYMVMRNNVQEGNSFMEKVLIIISTNMCHTSNALSAIYLIYIYANRESVLRFLSGKQILITLSGYCYGVYIYQQFILKLLYYRTQLPFVVNVYWLPWIAAGITIVLSLLLCHYSLKTRLGKFLIG